MSFLPALPLFFLKWFDGGVVIHKSPGLFSLLFASELKSLVHIPLTASKCGVETKIIAADFSCLDIYSKIEAELAGLEIGVLGKKIPAWTTQTWATSVDGNVVKASGDVEATCAPSSVAVCCPLETKKWNDVPTLFSSVNSQ